MVWPTPTLAAAALLVALVAAWWIGRRLQVAHSPVALMVTRIGFPGGLRVADVDAAVAALELRDEIVIPFSRAILVIDFPLTNPAHVEIRAALPQGFTRAELVRTVCEEYEHIYAAEEGTSLDAGPVVEDRGQRRERRRTDGAYGIWGHELTDLVLSSARWVKHSNGEVRIDLHVEARAATDPGPPAPQLPGQGA